jgi:hypothetical protein
MPLWGNLDQSSNLPKYANVSMSLTKTNAYLFGNTSQSVQKTNVAIGVFGVSPTEIGTANAILAVTIGTGGSGYTNGDYLQFNTPGLGSGANVSINTNPTGNATSVTFISRGSNYSFATTANAVHGSGVGGTFTLTIGGDGPKAAHAGWVVRRVGQGGRAGRVQTEVLVAMSSISTDATGRSSAANSTGTFDDLVYPGT